MKEKKNLIQWETIETEIKEDSKFKKIIKMILSFISCYSGWIEAILLLILTFKIKESESNKYWFLILALSIYLFYRVIKNNYKVWKSKNNIRTEEQNKRVVGHEGYQGTGKTSLMLYIAYVMERPVFTSAPAKINGEFTYKLTDSMLNMDERLPYAPMLLVDEISLKYDNTLSTIKDRYKTEGFEFNLQLIRHNNDGYFIDASVDMNRVAKRVEEKHGMFRRLLGQKNIRNSFIIDSTIEFISYIFRLDIKTGYRVWTYQTFETINHENYIFDLSKQTENTKNNHFANLNEIWARNSKLCFEYDDRYFKTLYLQLPKAKLEKWTSLSFDLNDIKNNGFCDITKFYEKKLKNLNIENESGD